MLNIIENTLNEVKLADPQHFRSMSVFPLLYLGKSKLKYLTLRNALKQEYIRITEVSEGGSVPELKLINMSESYILLLDGEEIKGAKQNRVLNTTLLVYPKSELVVPVSCTEQGRWNHVSDSFKDSERIMFGSARRNKMRYVNQSLMSGQGYRSDQSEVWKNISQLQNSLKTISPTSAMGDTYEDEKVNLENFLNEFELIEEQCGIIVGLGGEVAGLEYLSSSAGYSDVHRQLIESYAMDALVKRSSTDSSELTLEESQRFLEQIWSATQKTFPSAAAGTDVRLESDHLVGSALVEEDELIHLSAFSRQNRQQEYSPRMASYRSPRRYH